MGDVFRVIPATILSVEELALPQQILRFANLIREGKTFQMPSVMQMSKADGMQLLDQAIMDLLMRKTVSPEEAYIKANDKKTFEKFLKP